MSGSVKALLTVGFEGPRCHKKPDWFRPLLRVLHSSALAAHYLLSAEGCAEGGTTVHGAEITNEYKVGSIYTMSCQVLPHRLENGGWCTEKLNSASQTPYRLLASKQSLIYPKYLLHRVMLGCFFFWSRTGSAYAESTMSSNKQ